MLGWTCQQDSGALYFNFLYNRSPLWGRVVRVEPPRPHSFSSVVITDPHLILQLCRWHSSGGGGWVGLARGWNSNEVQLLPVRVLRVGPKPCLCCGQSWRGVEAGACLWHSSISMKELCAPASSKRILPEEPIPLRTSYFRWLSFSDNYLAILLRK